MFGNDLVLLIIIFPIAEIVIFLLLNWHWKKSGRFGRWRKAVSLSLCLITIFITLNLLLSTDYRKSTVDVSPMAELTVEQVYMLEDVIKQIENHDFVSKFSVGEGNAGRTYSFHWWNPESDSGVSASVDISSTEGYAINCMTGKPDPTLKKRYRLISYDNDTEAKLFHARVSRNEYFGSASWERVSYMRFGNSFMMLSEGEDSINRNGASDFVEWICELLKDESYQRESY